MSKYAIPSMLEAGGGAVVNIGFYPIVTLENETWYKAVELYCEVTIGDHPRRAQPEDRGGHGRHADLRAVGELRGGRAQPRPSKSF